MSERFRHALVTVIVTAALPVALAAYGVQQHPAEGFLDGGVEHAHAGAPDVGPGAVAFDERDDRIVRHDELSVLARDSCAHKFFRSGHLPSAEDFRERCGKVCGKRLTFTPL